MSSQQLWPTDHHFVFIILHHPSHIELTYLLLFIPTLKTSVSPHSVIFSILEAFTFLVFGHPYCIVAS